ncbi:MAG TPA: lytic transglycosylase domain-containing protein [Acidimicrobiia bacterium]
MVIALVSTLTPLHPAQAAENDCEVVTGTRLIDCGMDVRGEIGVDAEWWRPMVALYFEPEDVERAMCLMGKESGGQPEARNSSTGAAGLMQVMPFWADRFGYSYSELFDPGINLWVARQIRDEQGWRAWSPYLRGSCH